MKRFALALVLAPLALAPVARAGSVRPTEVKKAFKSRNPDKAREVLERLRGELDKRTVETVFKNALRLKPLGLYDDLVATLRTAEGDALEAVIKVARKDKRGDLRFLAVDALGKNPAPEAERTLAEAVKKDRDAPVRVLAVRLLGQRATTTAVDALIPLLAEFEGDPKQDRLVREINAALQNLTGQELSVAQDWKNYWDNNKDRWTKPEDHAPGTTKTRGTVLDRMKKQRPAELKTLTRMRQSELIVIKGNDRVESVLKALKLKHRVITREEFEKLELKPDEQTLLFNCPGKAQLSEQGIQKVRAFVAAGGYIFCSDWELGKTLAKAFPEVVTFLRESPRSDSPKDTRIRPFPEAAEHPLMRDVFPLNTWESSEGMAWKLEGRSHMVKEGPGITRLITCPDLKSLGSTCVAFTFAYTSEGGGRPVTGRRPPKRPPGRVLWVSSHFKLQKDPKSDGFALQQLLLNFILDKQEQRRKLRALGGAK